ncbi:MAG: 4Fe-4S binding protein [Candidatus Omnitrophica bacterium]|nr:4Fe-4S binding protein [Candidatus Omnitrophota bacterium]
MAKRKIIKINKQKCNGCGLCIPNCPEGAIQIIDGKAHLISDLFCDGLGACLDHCPKGAIAIEEREAENYDERKVMKNIVACGPNVIKAHLQHLRDHKQMDYLKEALSFLEENHISMPLELRKPATHSKHAGCPGARMMQFGLEAKTEPAGEECFSALRQWPVQLHLVAPSAPYFKGKDVLLTADCVAYALGNFHTGYLSGKSLAIACPKLDSGKDIYLEKLTAIIDEAKINTLSVMIMEVPCCGGLLAIAQEALAKAKRKIPLKCITVGIKGDIIKEEWVTID